ncbi:MAG: HD domain-containing protein [Clostridiales bacterium]|jgi:3'-5' exoribonuclease|nr:HD domain-containing protein [Clostridiales bacterium]
MNFKISSNGASEGFCFVKSAERRTTAKGAPFLDILLTDSAGEISAKLWDYKEDSHSWIAPNIIVKVRGVISEYNGSDQMRIEKIRLITDRDNVSFEDVIPSAHYEGRDMLDEIYGIVKSFKNDELRRLVLDIIGIYEDRLLYWPAAIRLHHAVRGGLLLHILSILRLAQRVCEIYPFIDSELLFSGAILHDIAKIEELEVTDTGVATGHTTDGALIGHLARGAIIIESRGSAVGVSKETRMLLEHMLLSHHGEPDFGSATRPMFLEAQILSELDMLDAHIYEFSLAVSGVESGGFSSRQWALDNRRIYNHGRSDTEAQAKLFD